MKRLSELDFLRAIAVLLVMLLHSQANSIMVRMGWIGVDLFFVLSGFLVSGLLFEEYKAMGQIRPFYFLIRRGFKIYPLFYFVLVAHLLYYFLKDLPISSSQLFAEVFFYQNYQPGLLGISWSLAIEEHFYLLLVIVIYLVCKYDKMYNSNIIYMGCFFVCIICLALRIYTFDKGYKNVFVNDFPTHLRLDALAFGVLLSYWLRFNPITFASFFRRYKSLVLVFSILCLIPFFIWERSTFIISTIGYSLLFLSFGLIMSLAVIYSSFIQKGFQKIGMVSFYQLMAFIGRYSYAIYLCHFFVGSATVSWLKKNVIRDLPGVIYIITYLVSCILVGILLSKLIEKPFLAIRERYFPKNKVTSLSYQ